MFLRLTYIRKLERYIFDIKDKITEIDDSKNWNYKIEIDPFYSNIVLSICDWATENQNRIHNLDPYESESFERIKMIEDFKTHFIEQNNLAKRKGG